MATIKEKLQDIHWETLTVDAALETLNADTNGLSDAEATERLALYAVK